MHLWYSTFLLSPWRLVVYLLWPLQVALQDRTQNELCLLFHIWSAGNTLVSLTPVNSSSIGYPLPSLTLLAEQKQGGTVRLHSARVRLQFSRSLPWLQSARYQALWVVYPVRYHDNTSCEAWGGRWCPLPPLRKGLGWGLTGLTVWW